MHHTSSTRRWRVALAAACAATLGACTDPSSGPAPRLSSDIELGDVTDGARSDSMFVPNWRKYSDSGSRPVVGRAGNAAMGMWALLSKDGSAQVEVVAGAWGGWTRGRRMYDDSIPSSGARLVRAQVKVFGPDGDAIATKNHDVGAPGATLPADGLVRGGRAQVQGVIDGASFARVGVVTLDAPALLRPDLTVTSVQSGPRAGV